ncbi:hypothetical protein P3S68_003761 [Capsicum galapagoense]
MVFASFKHMRQSWTRYFLCRSEEVQDACIQLGLCFALQSLDQMKNKSSTAGQGLRVCHCSGNGRENKWFP